MSISNEYVGLYFYSTIFQGNMALLGLLGVFVVFKRQELTSELQGKENAIVTFVQNYLDLMMHNGTHIALSYKDVPSLHKVIRDISEDKGYAGPFASRAKALYDDPNMLSRLAEREDLLQRRSRIFRTMIKPFVFILSVIVVSLILLPFAYSIHNYIPNLEIYPILLLILLNIYALFISSRFVVNALRD